MARGRLVVFEGAEGVGKSTQVQLLAEALTLSSVPAVTFREPGGTSVGDLIRGLVLHDSSSRIGAAAEALLFMASRAELCEKEIRPALDRGLVVLLDRFFLSTYAYQVAARGLPEEDVRAANTLATGGLVPDLTVLLDLPMESGLERASARGTRDRIEQSADDFHRRVHAAFRVFTDPSWSATHPEVGPVVRVDAAGTREQVLSRIVQALVAHFPDPFAGLGGKAFATASQRG